MGISSVKEASISHKRALIVVAHPKQDGFSNVLAQSFSDALCAAGKEVDIVDLYRDNFDPRLSADELDEYGSPNFEDVLVSKYVDLIRKANVLVFVYPTWWFNYPAILKGFFDRIFLPGVAFVTNQESGRIARNLHNIDWVVNVTTAASSFWIYQVLMRNPTARLIRRAIGPFFSKQARFRSLTLHGIEETTEESRQAFAGRATRTLLKIME